MAVADHHTIEGALRLQEMAPFRVIVAEEIKTSSGEVMGLFLREAVPPRLPVEEAVARIKGQGGLVAIPHPCESLRKSLSLDRDRLQALLPDIAMIEVFNARTPLPWDTARARRLARRLGLPSTAGSDAHTPGEIGSTYVEMAEFAGPQDFLQALARGRIVGRRASPLVHLLTAWAKLKYRLRIR